MIELENEHNGIRKKFDISFAEKYLKSQATKPYKGWKIPEDSEYKFSDGAIIRKAKRKREE